MSRWFFYFMRKCIYEILDFFFLKMHLWMYVFCWNVYIMYVGIFFYEKMHSWNFGLFLFENAFMNGWFFFECIYNVYNVCMDDFFYGKIHLWRRDFFLFENAFMNTWFFWMHKIIIFFLECIYKWNFWECIYNVQNVRKNTLNILWMYI